MVENTIDQVIAVIQSSKRSALQTIQIDVSQYIKSMTVFG